MSIRAKWRGSRGTSEGVGHGHFHSHHQCGYVDAADGALSLRDALVLANGAAGEDTITFDADVFTGGANSLIRLTQGELLGTESVHIDGSAATDLVITPPPISPFASTGHTPSSPTISCSDAKSL